MSKKEKIRKGNTPARSAGENRAPETAEEQKAHQEHLRRLRKYKKKHKQQIVGLVLELLLLVVVIGGYVAVSWTEGIFNNMRVKSSTTNPAHTVDALPTNPMGGENDETPAEDPTVVSWTNTDGQVFTDTMPPSEDYTNPLPRRAVEAQEGYWTLVCFGVDARDSTTMLRNTQGDVVIIVTIDKETSEIRLASVYRDTLFEFATGQYCKLTDAYHRYGAAQVMEGLNRNLDINVTDFVVVNWSALADIVDMLGGIDVEVTELEAIELNKYIYETMLATGRETTIDTDETAGIKHFDGVHAVSYSRIRKNVGSDYARTERQRKVIGVILEEVKGLLRSGNFGMLIKLVELVSLNIQTNLDPATISGLALDAGKYSIKETTGFPRDVREKPGSTVLCAMHFGDDVKALHEYLYGLEDYEPSDNVKRIEDFHRYAYENPNVIIP